MSTTISGLAGQAYEKFETRTRDDGESYVTLKDGAPEWLHDLVREAHGEFLPDDWRYDAIQAAVGAIHDSGADDDRDLDDLSHEFADSHVDVYNAARSAWLASNLHRAFYCDDAVSDGLVSPDADMFQRLGVGQYAESQEVFESVRRLLADRLEDLEAEGDD